MGRSRAEGCGAEALCVDGDGLRVRRLEEVPAEDACTDRYAAPYRLTEEDDVGLNPSVIHAQPPARPPEAGLNLIRDIQNVVLLAEPLQPLVPPGVPLNWLYEDCGDLVGGDVALEGDVLDVARQARAQPGCSSLRLHR